MTGQVRRARGLAPLATLVAAGGALGVLGRAGLEHAFPADPDSWPWTTFGINLSGALLLGALLEILVRTGGDHGWRKGVRLGAGTGFLGGYTTYSSFTVEIVQLADHGQPALGAVYALASVTLGLLAAFVGIAVAAGIHRGLTRPTRSRS